MRQSLFSHASGVKNNEIPMASLNKNLISAYAAYFFRYIYLIVLIPFYARVLGPSAYGLVLAAMSIQNIVWATQNWGFAFTGIRNLAGLKTESARNQEFNRHLTARFLLAPLAIGVGIASVAGSALLSSHPGIGGLAILCGVIGGFNLGWYFQGRQNFNTPVMIEITGFCITLPLVLLLVRSSDDAIYVMVALTISALITTTAAYFIASKSEVFKPASVGEGSQLIKQSTALFITGGASALMTNIGTYALATFSSSDQVAYFGTTEKIITSGLGLLAPVGQVLLAWFSKLLHETNDPQEVLRQQKRAIKWVCIAACLATLASLTVVPPLLNFALGKKFEHASTVLMVMCPIFMLAAFNNSISVYIFLPRRMEREVSAISVSTAVLGIGITILGAWLNGAIGAAIARVLSEFISSLALITLYWRKRETFKQPHAVQ